LEEARHRLEVSDQVVRGKDRDREELLFNYRKLSDDYARSTAAAERFASEALELRSQLTTISHEATALRGSVDCLEDEKRRLMVDLEAVERANSHLTLTVASARQQVDKAHSERAAATALAAEAKGSAANMELGRHEMSRAAAALKHRLREAEDRVKVVEGEKTALSEALEVERYKVRELEALAATHRERFRGAAVKEQEALADSRDVHGQLQTTQAQLQESYRQLEAVRSKLDVAEAHAAKMERRLGHEKEERERISGQTEDLQSRVAEVTAQSSQRKAVAMRAEEEARRLRQQLDAAMAENEASETACAELRRKLNSLEASARRQNTALDAEATDKASAKAELERLRLECRRLQEKLTVTAASARHSDAEQLDAKAKMGALEGETEQIRGDLENARDALAKERTRVVGLRQDNERLNQLLDKADSQNKELSTRLQAMDDHAPSTLI